MGDVPVSQTVLAPMGGKEYQESWPRSVRMSVDKEKPPDILGKVALLSKLNTEESAWQSEAQNGDLPYARVHSGGGQGYGDKISREWRRS